MANSSASSTADWQTIGEQQNFYDERDCLHPSDLASKKLRNRGENDVVIFDYSLDLGDGDPPAEGNGLSSGHLNSGDRFFQTSKDDLMSPEKFDRIIEPQLTLSRLGIM